MKTRNFKLIVIEGLAANILFGTLFIWTLLRNPLLELFPDWTEGMLSVIFGIHNLFVCAGILLAGRLASKIHSRGVFRLFALLVIIGMGGFAFLPESNPDAAYVMAFILFCCFTATGVGMGINIVQSTTIPWFPNHSGAISGALYMALGLSSFILTFPAKALLPVVGVKMMLPLCALLILIVSTLILLDKNSITRPEIPESGKAANTGLRPKEMLRTSAFWLLILWNIALRTCGLTLLDHAASIAAFYGGLTVTSMLISPANALGSITVGAAMDKLGLKKIAVTAALLMTAASLFLIFGTKNAVYPSILVGLLLAGYAYGGSSSSYAAGIKNTFGPKYYTGNFAISNLAMGCAALLESTSGNIYDATNYTVIMIILLVLSVIAAVLSLFFRRKPA